MSQVRVSCPSCQAALAVKHPWAAGAAVRCPHCQNRIDLPDSRRFASPAAEYVDPMSNSAFGMPLGASSAPQSYVPAAAGFGSAYGEQNTSGGVSKLFWILLAAGGGMAGALIVVVLIVVMALRSPPQPGAAPEQAVAAAPAAPATAQPAPTQAATAQPTTPQPTTPQPAIPQPMAPQNPASQPAPPLVASAAPPAAPAPASPSPPPPSPAPVAAQPSASATAISLPPQQAAPITPPPSTTGAALAYRWNPGEDYAYFFTVKADVAGVKDESSGMITIKASTQSNVGDLAAATPVKQGSGTGFVISSDGCLVTCAHVVEGASKIEVIVAGQNLVGQVIALDKPHDLALVRVQATNLPTVPLANSDEVQLAQEVRAVGFPLSDVLGESVKVTRGTVAGIINPEGRKLFQVDASINPGNSGGPLVNEMGHVVGVASAKLAGEDIDGVGFAVVSNDVTALLNSQRIPFQTAQASVRLEGPELARRVTPAVAMLKVVINPGGAGKRQALEFNGHVTANRRVSANGRPVLGIMPRPEFENGKLLVTEFGEVLDASGSVQLPYLLGALGPLTIEPLASSGERTWRTERAVALTQTIGDQNSGNMPFHFRRPRGFRSPFAPQTTQVVITPAMEISSYEILSSGGDQLLIKKRYLFKTLQKQGSPPLAEVTGEGTITFNQKGGFAEKFEYKANLVRSSGNVAVTIPVTLSWNRASAEQLADIKRRAAELAEKRKADEIKAAQPPTAEELDGLLADLAPDQDFSHKYNALNALKKKQPVDAQRARVTGAVEPMMLDSNASLRRAAIGVMGAWGTKDDIPKLVKLLDQLDSLIRMAAIEALGQIKAPASAEALAPLLANQSDQHNAMRALEALCEIAEPAVIKMLNHADKQVRYHACKTLGKIGGKRSVAAIKKQLRAERDSFARLGAEGALRDLQKRGF